MAGQGASWEERLATWAWGWSACIPSLSEACVAEWAGGERADFDVRQWKSEGSDGAGWASGHGLRLLDGQGC